MAAGKQLNAGAEAYDAVGYHACTRRAGQQPTGIARCSSTYAQPSETLYTCLRAPSGKTAYPTCQNYRIVRGATTVVGNRGGRFHATG